MESGEDRVDTQEETVACATHNQVEDSVDGNHCDVRVFVFYETVRSYISQLQNISRQFFEDRQASSSKKSEVLLYQGC